MKWVKVGKVTVKLNLTTFMRKAGAAFVKAMQSAIGAKQDINGRSVKKNAPATVKGKGFDHRGIATGNTKQNAFDFRAAPQSLTLFVSGTHPNGTSYDDIVYYNQPTTAKTPGGASGRNPGAEWFGVPDKAEEAFYIGLQDEVMNQVEAQCKFHHTLKVAL